MFDSLAFNLMLVISGSAIFAAALVPLFFRLAVRIGLVDKPDAKRKLHEKPIPLVGGLVIFVSTLSIVLIAVLAFGSFFPVLANNPVGFKWEHLGLLIAAAVILGIGVLDDRFKIRGRHKLLGQILAATVLIAFGYHFNEVSISRWSFSFGLFAIFIVYFWILGAINSVNLLDGADGFAGTLGFVVSLAMTVIAMFASGKYVECIIAASLAGSIGGFLMFNLPPAKIYLGDAGSMLIGLLLGALAISTSLKEQAFYALVAPVAILTIPILDSVVAITRRKLTGRGIYAVDRGHIHHSLLRQGLSPRMAVLWMFVLCSTTAIGGAISFVTRESEFAIISVALVVGFLVAGRVFGFAEFSMVGRKASAIAFSFLRRGQRHNHDGCEQYQLQGTRDWGQLFQAARDFAEKHGYQKVAMDINAPWIHESYHATWKSHKNRFSESADEWSANFPLIIGDRIYGRIELLASADQCDAYRSLPQLIEMLETSGPALIEAPVVSPIRADEARSGQALYDSQDSAVLSGEMS